MDSSEEEDDGDEGEEWKEGGSSTVSPTTASRAVTQRSTAGSLHRSTSEHTHTSIWAHTHRRNIQVVKLLKLGDERTKQRVTLQTAELELD